MVKRPQSAYRDGRIFDRIFDSLLVVRGRPPRRQTSVSSAAMSDAVLNHVMLEIDMGTCIC